MALDFGFIISKIGTAIGFGLNLSPGVLFYEIFTGKKTYKDLPELMFISGTLCNTLNLDYSLIIKDPNMQFSNYICTSMIIIYSGLYIWFFSEKNIPKFLLYIFIAYDLTFELIYGFWNVLEYHAGYTIAENFVGWATVFLGIINSAAPGQKIFTVISTGNYTLIPIVTTLFQFACSFCWFLYALVMKNDLYVKLKMIIPNALGVFLTAIQIAVFWIFYTKNKNKDFSDKDNENDNDVGIVSDKLE